ncbi:hypothetical protein [Streptomyces mobaraensis]|uniref:Uncharacterized protein n=1 Tax=Streptomyces mobaraensis TaxID=35621 RepID=A0A5N5VZD5_STRMB|nr:hypothetical protein [Streptomyces mobaraensis]KAB7833530.1 hypothetical protein FRZ00_33320 [Streptomyces mobaraensis]
MSETTVTTAVELLPLPESWTVPEGWKRHVLPVDPDNVDSPLSRRGYEASAHYTLDVERRQVSVHLVTDEARHRNVELGESIAPFTLFRSSVVPSRLDLGALTLRYHLEMATAETINSLLAETEPLVRELLDHLVPVPGTGAKDWTPRAFDAARRLRHLIDRRPYRGTEYDFPHAQGSYVVAAGDFFQVFPSLVQHEWAEATGEALERAIEGVHQAALRITAVEHLERLIPVTLTGKKLPDGQYGPVTSVIIVGTRAWLHTYRQQQAGDLTPMDTARWDGAPGHALHVQDDSSDADLQAVAERALRDAAGQGIKLLGVDSWAENLRAERRTAVRRQLEALGADIGEMEKSLKPMKQRRKVLVTRVLGWDEQDTDSSLGRLAGMSHTAVGDIREALAKDDTE